MDRFDHFFSSSDIYQFLQKISMPFNPSFQTGKPQILFLSRFDIRHFLSFQNYFCSYFSRKIHSLQKISPHFLQNNSRIINQTNFDNLIPHIFYFSNYVTFDSSKSSLRFKNHSCFHSSFPRKTFLFHVVSSSNQNNSTHSFKFHLSDDIEYINGTVFKLILKKRKKKRKAV